MLQAGVLTMMALMGILTDMERPARMIWFMLTPNPTSPFLYTGSAAGGYMALCFVDLWVLITGRGGHKLAMTMTLIALPFAIYMHTTTAFVLSMNKSRELWHSAVMVPIFLTSATASGISLLLIFAYIVQSTTQIKFKPSMFRSLSTLLATVMIIDLFLLVVEILSIFWPTSAMPGHTIRMVGVHHRQLRVGVPAGAHPRVLGVLPARSAAVSAHACGADHGGVHVPRGGAAQALLAHGDGLRPRYARAAHAASTSRVRSRCSSRSASFPSACSSSPSR